MRYWIYWNDLVQGPFEVQELVGLRAFTADLLVCEEDRQDWVPAAAIYELLPYFQPVLTADDPRAPAPPPPPPRHPPALEPLQGEFFNEPVGQQPLFDMNGKKNYVFRPVGDAAQSAPESAPMLGPSPFQFRVISPRIEFPAPPGVEPPPARTPETPRPVIEPVHPDLEETGSGAVEPEEQHAVEPDAFRPPPLEEWTPQKHFVPPPLEEEPPVPAFKPPLFEEEPPQKVIELPAPPPIAPPPKVEKIVEETIAEPPPKTEPLPAPKPATAQPSHVFRAPRVAIPDFETRRQPEPVEAETRLWPWLLGVGIVLAIVGVGIFYIGHLRAVKTIEPVAPPVPEVNVNELPVTQTAPVEEILPPAPPEPPSVWQPTPPTELKNAKPITPAAVMLDAQGRVWITDPQSHQLQAAPVSADAKSVQVEAWAVKGRPGVGAGQFHMPAGLVTDSRGRIWVADKGNNRIQMYDPDAKQWVPLGEKGSAAGQFDAPSSVAVDAQGHVWVADKANHRIQSFDPESRQWSLMGQQGSEVGQFNYPAGIAIDAQGMVWIADQGNNRVQMYNPVTSEARTFGRKGKAAGSFNSPTAVAVDSHGRVWVADQGNHRLQVYNPQTEKWVEVGTRGHKTGEFETPSGIAFDVEDRVWVADRGNHRLQTAKALVVAPLKAGKRVKQTVPAPAPAPSPAPTVKVDDLEVKTPPEPEPAPPPPSAPSEAVDKWRGKEQAAIELTLKQKIYGGKRTIAANAKMMLEEQHDKELLHAAETGERLYLPDKIAWSALHEEGPRYRVYLNFQAMQANGERMLTGSDHFLVNLDRLKVEAGDEAARRDFFDPTAIKTYAHSAKADEIETLLNGVDAVNKAKLHAVILSANAQKEAKKKLEAELQAAEAKFQKEVVYFRTKYAEKTLQNIGKAYGFLAVLKGK